MVTKPKYVTKRSMSQYDLSSAFRLSPVGRRHSIHISIFPGQQSKKKKNKTKTKAKTNTKQQQQQNNKTMAL